MYRLIITILSLFILVQIHGENPESKKIFVFPIRENIMPSTARLTDKCLNNAIAQRADMIVIDINTYGGILDAADSIRTRILNCPIPIIAFINNQAASAGALISIAADTIFMRDGGSIGAATVVDQGGAALPDKYQSFMRSMMRSTAEAHGKIAVVRGADTTWRWFRDPQIAQAMVDPRIVIPGLDDSTKVLTLTAQEAIENGYCEGKAASVEQILDQLGIETYTITEYKPTTLDKIMGWLTNPAVQGIFIMLIIGGIYFELQSPGIGFPLIIAICGAVLYFAPLYLEGFVENWELIIFIIGIILVAVEIFVIPGFGVTGIVGIGCVVIGLTFAAIDGQVLKQIPVGSVPVGYILQPFMVVIISMAVSLIGSIWLAKRLLTGRSYLRKEIVLTEKMNPTGGYLAHKQELSLVGMSGVAATVLRPSGKVQIDGLTYQASALDAQYIEAGSSVIVVSQQGGVLYCRKQ